MSGPIRFRRAPAAVSLVALICVALAPQAAAASRPIAPRVHAWTSVITAPADGVLVRKRSVRVAVTLRAKVRSFQATLRGHGLGREFRRRGSQEVATLAVGRTPGLRFGRNTVRVRTSDGNGRRGFTSVTFVLARQEERLLRRVAAHAVAGEGADLRIGLSRPDARVAIRVDGGRTVRRHIAGRGGTIPLDADQGIRPGLNQIAVQAVDRAAGLFASSVVEVRRPAGVPVAGAGPSRRRAVNEVVRFDAGASAAPKGASLRYRWRIVSAPRGSRARLRGAWRVRPTLRPDRPGKYVLKVSVAKVAGTAARASSVSPPAEAPDSFDGESTDSTSLTTEVAAPPIGVPIDTIAKQEGALGVALGTAADGGGFFAQPEPAKALQLVVFSRETLAMLENRSFENNNSGAGELLSVVEGLKSSDLVVITKPSPGVNSNENPATGNATAGKTINEALAKIGVEPVLPEVSTGNGTPCVKGTLCSSFSVIGVPGIPVGQGNSNPGMDSPPGSPVAESSEIGGYFQSAVRTNSGFVFVNRERVPFDTGLAEADQAVVTVGEASYTSERLEGAGFFVLVLDAGDLSVVEPGYTYSLGTPAPGANVGTLAQMAAELHEWESNPDALVIVRSIGAVGHRPGAPWDQIASSLERIGGSRYLFDALNGTSSHEYAQVGIAAQAGPGLSEWTQIASQGRNGTGRLSGLLGRNSNSMFYAAESAPPGTPIEDTIGGLLSTPPDTSWPLRENPQSRHVLECVAEALGLSYPIEGNYENLNIAWGDYRTTLVTGFLPKLRQVSGCGSISEAEFSPVETQLETEWKDLDTVHNLIKNLESPYSGAAGENADLESIVEQVKEDLEPGSTKAQYNALGISSDVLWILSAVVPEGETALNLLSGVVSLAAEIDVEPDGSNAIGNIVVPASQVGVKLKEQYEGVVAGIADEGSIIMSNWSMLQIAAARAVAEPRTPGSWAWTEGTAKRADENVAIAIKRADYEGAFPSRFGLYRLSKGTGELNPENVTTYTCVYNRPSVNHRYAIVEEIKPFANVQRYGGVAPSVNGAGEVEQWVYAGYGHEFLRSGKNPEFPSAPLLQSMFVTSQSDLPNGEPLFKPLEFALGAYANGSAATTVTHYEEPVNYGVTKNACRVR